MARTVYKQGKNVNMKSDRPNGTRIRIQRNITSLKYIVQAVDY